jgi:hypothetical protein
MSGVIRPVQQHLPLLQTTYKDGKEDGLWEEFDKDGQLRGRENWIDGKIEGLSEFYRNGEEDECRAGDRLHIVRRQRLWDRYRHHLWDISVAELYGRRHF